MLEITTLQINKELTIQHINMDNDEANKSDKDNIKK